jgi:hypothetical protein
MSGAGWNPPQATGMFVPAADVRQAHFAGNDSSLKRK